MSNDNTMDVTNLLLAAVLQCGGADVDKITPHRRYSSVTLALDHFSRDQLAEKIRRLLRVVERAETDQELSLLFGASMLGEVEDRYIRLKRRVVQEREKHG